ncbi:glycoside hydrolase family 3 protein [Clostridiaceae bacterium]|nr:glycoside hydrolase family 3 protein [Clostridium sp.]NBI71815.1 glycoside hydrolase family 3 protein [Clostridiaceae bacterium]
MREDLDGRGRRQAQSRKRGAGRRGRSGMGGVGFLSLVLAVLVVTAGWLYWYKLIRGEKTRVDERDRMAEVETEFFPDDPSASRVLLESSQVKETAGESETGEAAREETSAETPAAQKAAQTPKELMERMTLEEKVLQLFIITPEALTGVDEVYAAGTKTREAIDAYPVGGLVYFRQNLKDPAQVKDMLSRSKGYFVDRIGIAPFLSVDEEGGQVTRIGGRREFGAASFPDMSKIGANGDPGEAYRVGTTIGEYLSEYGFNVDFAPVADVLTNPENTVVARRSFGSDGAAAAAFTNEVIRGLEEKGVEAVLKHFPGHGGTAADSHKGYAQTLRTLEEMREEEFVPFREGIKAGCRFVMVGHISAPKAAGDERPAIFSKKMVTDILRGELGFDGIIVTDAMNMKAVTDSYGSSEAAVLALQAGVDMLLMPADFRAAYSGVMEAVKNGTLSEARIEESVQRILTVKMGME